MTHALNLSKITSAEWLALAASDVPKAIHDEYIGDHECDSVKIRRIPWQSMFPRHDQGRLQILISFATVKHVWIQRGALWERQDRAPCCAKQNPGCACGRPR